MTLLADRYRLVERIAVGGMGEVWRADDTLIGRPVAVKTLKAEYVGDDDFRARFRAEARHAGRLGHPGIACVYDFGECAESAWLVMELVDGEPLSGLLRREGRLSARRTLDLVAQTAAALQAAHDGGVVHRDVKPGNLLVRRDGVLKVTDFGIASATDAVPLTQTGTVIGTACYLSPEQAAGGAGSPASDLYALGVVAYECLAGARPFPATNPVAVALAHLRDEPPPLPADLPTGVRELVTRALAKDPEQRFPDAQTMAARALELQAELADDDGHALRTGGLGVLGVLPPAAVVDARTGEPTQVGAVPTHLIRAAGAGRDGRRARRGLPGVRARSARHAVRTAALLLVTLAIGVGLTAGQGDEPDTAVPAAGEEPSVAPSTAGPALSSAPPQDRVDTAAYDGRGTPVGTVSSVEPTGPLALGTSVLLHVVPQPRPVAEAPGDASSGSTGHKGRGNR